MGQGVANGRCAKYREEHFEGKAPVIRVDSKRTWENGEPQANAHQLGRTGATHTFASPKSGG